MIFLPHARRPPGHPILLGRMIWPEVHAGADEPLRTVIDVIRAPDRIHVEDPGILGT
jgi:hypothetical protein